MWSKGQLRVVKSNILTQPAQGMQRDFPKDFSLESLTCSVKQPITNGTDINEKINPISEL